MYVQPNTPTLPFETDCPLPTRAELVDVTAYFVQAARVCADDPDANAAVLAQAAASLVLVCFFTAPTSREARTLRRGVRAQRRWLSLVGPFLIALFFVGCAQAEKSPPLDFSDAGDVAEDAADLEQEDAAPMERDSAPRERDCGPLSTNLFGQDLRDLRGPACPGLALSSLGGDTRIEVDARTKLCTFPCEVQEVTGDPACHDAHAAHVRTFCASLGGTCVAEGDAPPRCIYWREVGR